MRRIWRLGLVAAVAVAAFAVAVGRFADAAEEGCAQRVGEDLAYRVRLLEPPRTDVTRYRLAVSRAGRAVTGAHVCVNAYMTGMSAMAVTDAGREVARGTYEVSLTFEMGGAWVGRALIAEPGKSTVAVPMRLRVRTPTIPTTAP